LFVGGYLLAWSGFAAVAAGAQWLLHDAALVDAMGTSTSRWVAGPVLVLAGAYQFSSLKNACLGKCRTPLGFLLSEWRSGRSGAVTMGVHHGTLCIGCCWALMALLFVLGVMNLWWIVLVATVVLIEKITRSTALPKAIGVLLIAWGAVVVAGLVEAGVSA
jgi:predicted metal-binding membrane protein